MAKINDNSNLVQSIERALNIIDTLAEYNNGCGIIELSKELGLSKATVHRLLSTLKYKGYVIQNPETEKYLLSTKFLYLASNVTNNLDIIKVAKPYIQSFSNKVGEVLHLCIADETNENIIYIDKIHPNNPNHSISMSSHIGKKAPIFCTASGKLLLSQYSNNEIKEMLKDVQFIKYTNNTLENIDDLLKEISEIRENHYALDNVEYDKGIICISVPVYDANNKIIAAISLSSVTLYYSLNELLEFKDDMQNLGMMVSKLIGYKH